MELEIVRCDLEGKDRVSCIDIWYSQKQVNFDSELLMIDKMMSD